MTTRERILAVYRGETPDVVPFMLDLSHWFYHKNGLPWDLSVRNIHPEYALIDYHKKAGAGYYVPNLNAFLETETRRDVQMSVSKTRDGREIIWEIETPIGCIRRKRRWEEKTYAWGVSEWGIHSEQDLEVLGYAYGNRTFKPHWDRFREWEDYVGDDGVTYISANVCSAMGLLLNGWAGIEGTVYAAADWRETMHRVVDEINAGELIAIDIICDSPADIVFMGDNFSSDIQPPHFFKEWSEPYYAEAIRRLHRAGKCASIHIDGKLRGALKMFRDIRADCADAVTPVPMGDLDPEECREEEVF